MAQARLGPLPKSLAVAYSASPDLGRWLGTVDLGEANGCCRYAMRLLIPAWQRIGPKRQFFQILHQICHSSGKVLVRR